MRLMTVEAVAVGLLSAALAAWCFITGRRRPAVGRLAATVVVSAVAAATIAMAAGALVVGEPDNPESIAGPVGASFLVLGFLIAVLAVVVQVGREVGRWLAGAVLGLLGTLVLWATVSEPLEDDTAVGSMVLLVIGLSFIACTGLLVAGSNVVRRSRANSSAAIPAGSSQPCAERYGSRRSPVAVAVSRRTRSSCPPVVYRRLWLRSTPVPEPRRHGRTAGP